MAKKLIKRESVETHKDPLRRAVSAVQVEGKAGTLVDLVGINFDTRPDLTGRWRDFTFSFADAIALRTAKDPVFTQATRDLRALQARVEQNCKLYISKRWMCTIRSLELYLEEEFQTAFADLQLGPITKLPVVMEVCLVWSWCLGQF